MSSQNWDHVGVSKSWVEVSQQVPWLTPGWWGRGRPSLWPLPGPLLLQSHLDLSSATAHYKHPQLQLRAF